MRHIDCITSGATIHMSVSCVLELTRSSWLVCFMNCTAVVVAIGSEVRFTVALE